MSVLLLMSLAISLILHLATIRWALRERKARRWHQAQLQLLRQQMTITHSSRPRTGRWFARFLVLIAIFWSLAVYLY